MIVRVHWIGDGGDGADSRIVKSISPTRPYDRIVRAHAGEMLPDRKVMARRFCSVNSFPLLSACAAPESPSAAFRNEFRIVMLTMQTFVHALSSRLGRCSEMTRDHPIGSSAWRAVQELNCWAAARRGRGPIACQRQRSTHRRRQSH